MASKMATVDTTGEHTRFARLCRMIVDMCRDMLWELLISKIPLADLPKKVFQNLSKLKLTNDQYHKIYKPGGALPSNTDVDISSLYTIIRNICPKIKAPTNRWYDEKRGNRPGPNDVKIGDDIERIRLKRNELYGHALEARLSAHIYQKEIAEIRCIVGRMDSRLKTEFHKYMKKLENSCMDPEAEEEYINMLLMQKKEDEKTREMVEDQAVQLKHTKEELKETQEDINRTKAILNSSTAECKNETKKLERSVEYIKTKQQESSTDVNCLKDTVKELDTKTKAIKGNPLQISITQTITPDQRNLNSVNYNDTTVDSSGDTKSIKTTAALEVPEQRKKLSYAAIAAMNIETVSDKPPTNLFVNNVNIHVNSSENQNETDPFSQFQGTRYGAFLTAVNNFNDSNFILITSEVERQKYLEYLALVPWTTVFDFDPNSRTTGLLSVMEDKILNLAKRSLNINCIEDSNVNNVKERTTHWMFCRGCRENSNTKQSYDFKEWEKDINVNSGMKSFIKKLREFARIYTKYRVVVLWPKEEAVPEFIYRLMCKLQKYIEPSVVLVEIENKKVDSADLFQKMICHRFKEKITSVSLKLKDVCTAVSLCQGEKFGLTDSSYQLPTSDNTNKVDIDPKQASWLGEDLFVLYLNKEDDTTRMTAKQLKAECDNFFKGGTLPWNVWYEVDAGHVDAKRDCMDEIIKNIENRFIKTYRTGLVTLLHAPGSGGTTLAQRILWQFMRTVPCVQAKLRTSSGIEDLVNRLDFLYGKTGLPILLMVDGEEEQRVENIMRHLRKACVVVLYVKRCPFTKKNSKSSNDTFLLQSTVTPTEANVLALKFGRQCDSEEKQQTIESLAGDVLNGKKKCIFEFGLAAYTYEFKGIEAYVRGYLQLPEKTGTLQPWQRALGMLSLAYYYGHIGIPCQFFSEMLAIGKGGHGKVISIKDFPESMQNMIVKDMTESKTNILRISHYYVAKEILEQILPWPVPRERKRLEILCIGDKKQLEKFAIGFISHAETMDKGEHGSAVIKILTKTFIIRENKAEISADGGKRKDDTVSSIFQDLMTKPTYTEMFSVMQQLTKSFPKDPHFFAHLGRLYSFYKPEKENEAETCFKTALKLCEKLTKGQRVDEMAHHMRLTFTITYFMFGSMYRNRVVKFTGCNVNQKKSKKKTGKDQYEIVANKLLELVNVARESYQRSREYDPDENSKNNAFIGEIHTCLMFCDFVYKQGGYQDISRFIQENDSPVSVFAEKCIYQIDDLFLEYFSSIDPDGFDENAVLSYQNWYCALFQNGLPIPGHFMSRNESIHTRRVTIAAMKLQNGNRKDNNIYGVIEDIDRESDITTIIKIYEDIFIDVHDNGINVSKSSLEHDYREWLVAIRHGLIKEPYTIEDVLTHIQRWKEKVHSPQSKFYMFVLKSILGFGNEHSMGNTHLLIEAQQLKDDVIKQTRYLVKSKYPKEWLGIGVGIRQLALGVRFFGQKEDKEMVKTGRIDPDQLALMKGTIRHPNNNPRAGQISLDLGKQNNVSVNVFYVPANFQMHFKTFAQQRVEFNIGFTYANGYEAFNIKCIQRIDCSACKLKVEATSRDKLVHCPCGNKNSVNDSCRK